MPQLQDIPDLIYQQDGAPPHFHNEVTSYLYERLCNRCIGRGDSTEWPTRSPDLTPMDFFLWGFVKDSVSAPRCRQHYTSSRHGSERPVQTLIRKFSTACGRRLNIGLMLLEPLVALILNFIIDKLLFIKLFNWSFRWYVFCKCNLK
jgi:hypothetical protein